MKKILIPFTLLFLLALSACGGKTIDPMEFTSPEGNRKILITGTQEIALDPIMTTVVITTEKGKKPFSFELQSNSLDESNVTVVWEDNDEGKITLVQTSGSKKVMNFDLSDGQVYVVQDLIMTEDQL